MAAAEVWGRGVAWELASTVEAKLAGGAGITASSTVGAVGGPVDTDVSTLCEAREAGGLTGAALADLSGGAGVVACAAVFDVALQTDALAIAWCRGRAAT